MVLKAGFSEIEITPPPGTEKAGWLRRIVGTTALDPLFARAAVFECGGRKIAFASLDILSIRWTQVHHIRTQVQKECGIPANNVMIAATHNHAGPAVVNLGETRRDAEYLSFLTRKVVESFVIASQKMVDVMLGVRSGFEGRISFNRRYIMKDGSVRTNPRPASPDILCAEGVIDPELGVLCVKDSADKIAGFLVNFACHLAHHGDDNVFSAGFPGVLAEEIKRLYGDDCVCLFLNGASGNIYHTDFLDPNYLDTPETMGKTLADDVSRILEQISFRNQATLRSKTAVLEIPIRDLDKENASKPEYLQRNASDQIYENSIRRLQKKRKKKGFQHVQIQILELDDTAFVGIPAEYFVEHGLRIKLESRRKNTYIVSCANGMVGYVPHREAFERGGYETTLAQWSKLIPEAGDIMAEVAIKLLSEMFQK